MGGYQAGDMFRVAIESDPTAAGLLSPLRVRYRKNGVLLYESTLTPQYPLAGNGSLFSPGATLANVKLFGLLQTMETATFINATGITVAGNGLTRTAATGSPATAVSSRSVAWGDGYVETTVLETSTTRAFGLANIDNAPGLFGINYALQMNAGGALQVYESGSLAGTFGSYSTGDVLRVAIIHGHVQYSRNGVVFYDNSLSNVIYYPLVASASMTTQNSTLQNVVLAGNVTGPITWNALSNVSVAGPSIIKNAGSSASWNGQAVSTEVLTGPGWVEFTAGAMPGGQQDTASSRTVGLSGTGSSFSGTVDYGFWVTSIQEPGIDAWQLLIQDNGATISIVADYQPGDRLRVEIDADPGASVPKAVRYRKNGVLLYASTNPAKPFPFRVEAWIFDPGGTVTDATLSGAFQGVNVSVSPATASLTAGQTQQLTATVTGNQNTAVTWSLRPGVGTISSSGLYTAPAFLNTAQTVVATATSVADNTKMATSTIALSATVGVSVAPSSVTLGAFESRQFTVTVTGSNNSGVTWSLSPNAGSISSDGVYVAPGSFQDGQSVTIRATSAADGATTGTAIVTLSLGVTVSVNPPSVGLRQAETQQFTANVGGTANTSVTWALVPGVGTISSNGLYTAPNSIGSPQTISVVATSVADGTIWASATVTLIPNSSLPVTWANFAGGARGAGNTLFRASGIGWNAGGISTMSIASGSGFVEFQAIETNTYRMAGLARNVTNADYAGIDFAIELAGDANQVAIFELGTYRGTFSTYQAGDVFRVAIVGNTVQYSQNGTLLYQNLSPGLSYPYVVDTSLFSLGATIGAGYLYGNLIPTALSVSVTPANVSLRATQTQQYTATVVNGSTGAVTWSISPATGAGTIDSSGLYTAPSIVPDPATVTVKATSQADGATYGIATVVLVPAISVSVTPATLLLGSGGTQQFNAAVSGTSNLGVAWSINPQTGSISPVGLYTAPVTISSPQNVTVIATSLVDGSKFGTATVRLSPLGSLSLSPGSAALGAGQSQQFTANSAACGSGGVNWSISPLVGSINSSGLYNAPGSVSTQQLLVVTAACVSDSALTATSQLTLTPAVAVSLTPATTTLTSGQTQQFAAAVTGSSNTAVTFSLSPTVGTISSAGVYTAPDPITTTQTLRVTAASAADPTKSASAFITLASSIAVNVAPNSITLAAGQTLPFTAAVTGTGNSAVIWSISPSGTGAISTSGVYTAPSPVAVPQTVNVTAVSAADGTKSGTATITLTPATIEAVSWTNLALVTANTNNLTRPSGAGWNSGALSTKAISSGDGYVEFTAQETTTYRVAGLTHRSNVSSYTDLDFGFELAEGNAVYIYESGNFAGAFGLYAIGDVFRVEISGGQIVYRRNGVIVRQLANPIIGYPLNAGASLFSAGATVNNTLLVGNLTTTSVSVSISPTSTSLAANQTQQFTATVSNSANTSVIWSISPTVGTLSANGLYTAPAVVNSTQTVTVKATSAFDGVTSADASVTLQPSIAVTLNGPATILLAGGGSQKYNATVTGTPNGAVTWSISPAIGTISSGGLYTAPATVGSSQLITITAASVANAGSTASARVNLTTSPMTPVTWTSLVSTTATGNTVFRPSGIGWNAGAVSTSALLSGDGFVEFTAQETNTYRLGGLIHGTTCQSYSDLTFGIELAGDASTVYIYQSGAFAGTFGTYAAGDLFRIEISGGKVIYRKNGNILYQNDNPTLTYPLAAGASLFSSGATLQNVNLLGNLGVNQ